LIFLNTVRLELAVLDSVCVIPLEELNVA
jgi:hypothetical protein